MIIEQLVDLYKETNFYPSNPELCNWEVPIDPGNTPAETGGMVWKGLFLGCICVAIKALHPSIPADVVMRVSLIFASMNINLI